MKLAGCRGARSLDYKQLASADLVNKCCRRCVACDAVTVTRLAYFEHCLLKCVVGIADRDERAAIKRTSVLG